jgi:thiol-disulfide isomerase/thioredoxin
MPPEPLVCAQLLQPARLALALGALLLLAPAASAVEAGQPAPAFSAPSLDGKGQRSLASYRGKVVYVDFWASWCTPCLTSLPLLEKLRGEFPPEQFQILAVNVDREPAKAKGFLARHPVGYPSVSDPEGRLPEVFALETMPTSYLIDARGIVRYVHEGFRASDVDEIRERIRGLLREAR